MNKLYLLYITFTFSCLFANADNKNMLIFGVYDEISYEPLSGVEFSLTNDKGSAVSIDSILVKGNGQYQIMLSVPDGNYSLFAEKDSYNPYLKEFKKTNRLGIIGLGNFMMKKSRILNEVTVTATRIKMVMRGDTVVYDAGAFELAEGSMLDALVAQLPGTELKDGRIMVNGKFVESLLVNGEDFFAGNPQIALQNLPAYTVKNIKVYDREARDAYLRGGKRAGDPEHIVMDVNLKKQYSYGALGNIDGGYGAHGRYLGKAFGMGYADNFRLAAYANFNNIKNTYSGGTSGSWGGGWSQDGHMDLQMGGIDYLWNKHDFRFSGNVMLTGERPNVQTKKSTVNYYGTGDIYGRFNSHLQEQKFHLLSSHQWSWSGKQIYAQLNPSVDYQNRDFSRVSQSASFDQPVAERYRGEALDSLFGGSTVFLTGLLNRIDNRTEGKSAWLKVDIDGNATISIPGNNDNIKLNAGYNYRRDTNNPNNTYFQMYSDAGVITRQQNEFESVSRKTYGHAEYNWWYVPYYGDKVSGLIVTPQMDVTHINLSKDNLLHQLIDEYSSTSLPVAGRLPLDAANTYHSRLSSMSYKPGIQLHYEFMPSTQSAHKFVLQAEISADIKAENLHYAKDGYVDHLSRTTTFIKPKLQAKYTRQTQQSNTELTANYSFSQSAPNLTYCLKTEDSSNPTEIYLNNPNLRNSSSNTASLRFNRFWKQTHRSVNASINYSMTDNAIAQARYYDRNTGVSTWRPENIDGNWTLNGDIGYTIPFGNREAFQFSGKTTAGFVNSANYATETEVLTHSVVRNLNIGQQASLSYRIGQHSFGLNGGVAWQRANSRIHLFETINACLYNARANCLLNFAYGWQVSSDLNLYARRGYSDNTLNTTDWIWNASLSKTFLKGQLTLQAEAIDILGQVSQIQNTINAQGRTETWVNSLPRYAMLHVIYRFHIMPKKK